MICVLLDGLGPGLEPGILLQVWLEPDPFATPHYVNVNVDLTRTEILHNFLRWHAAESIIESYTSSAPGAGGHNIKISPGIQNRFNFIIIGFTLSDI